MSITNWALSLLIVGSVLEAAGIGLTAREVVRAIKKARTFSVRPRVVAATVAMRARSSLTASMSGGTPPTLEAQVALLAEQLAALASPEREDRAFEQMEQTAVRVADTVKQEVEDQVKGLTDVVLSWVPQGVRAWGPPALFGLGLLTQFVSNWISLCHGASPACG